MFKKNNYDGLRVSKENIFQDLIAILKNIDGFPKEILLVKDIDESKGDICLVELGVGSIDYVSIIGEVQDRYQLHLSVDSFANVNKFSEVVEIIYLEVLKQHKVK